jgi:hypothetical protein
MTHSGDPWTESGMKSNNARHEVPMREFLSAVVRDRAAHARFMNMLSMLEHMGSRKIMVSQMNRTLTEDALKHLAEEARHAYFFKRQAERMAGHALDGYTEENTMCRIPALMYFGRLDAGISARAADKEDRDNQAYPWVSMIIELRACWLYHMYHEVLQEAKVSVSLKSLLAEEDLHLAEMYEMVGNNTAQLRELCAYETELFGKMLDKLRTEFSTGAIAAKAA